MPEKKKTTPVTEKADHGPLSEPPRPVGPQGATVGAEATGSLQESNSGNPGGGSGSDPKGPDVRGGGFPSDAGSQTDPSGE